VGSVERNDKQLKKDQHVVRDTRDEVEEEIRPGAVKPKIENPNRDTARGDWDRSGDHQDSSD
jgi:hypothetical protein